MWTYRISLNCISASRIKYFTKDNFASSSGGIFDCASESESYTAQSKTSQLKHKNFPLNLRFTNKIMIHNPELKIFFNWDSLHTRLNSHYEAWSYKKKKHKKIKAYWKSV